MRHSLFCFRESELIRHKGAERESMFANTARPFIVGLGCMCIFQLSCFAQPDKVQKTVLTGVQKDLVVTLDGNSGVCMLNGAYLVPKGCELKIQEGVKLVAGNKSSLVIQGELNIEGTKDKPVIIRASGSGLGAWNGIKLINCNGQITYLHMSGAKEAIYCQDAELRVYNSTFYRNELVIRTKDGKNVQLENCHFADNKSVFDAHRCQLELDHCNIVKTKGTIMAESWGGKTVCRDCVIEKNGAGFGGYSPIEMHGCSIQGNAKFDVNNGASESGDCTGNYWGKQNTGVLIKNGGTKLTKVIGSEVNLSDFLRERPEGCGTKEYPAETLK